MTFHGKFGKAVNESSVSTHASMSSMVDDKGLSDLTSAEIAFVGNPIKAAKHKRNLMFS
jgi:hypothetical protein